MTTKPSMIAASPMACRLPSPSTSTPAIGSTSEAADSVKVRPSRPREGVPPTIRQSASAHSVRSSSARQGGEEAAHQAVGERGRHGGDGVEPAPAGEAHRRRIAPVDDLDAPRAPHRDEVDRGRHQEHPERRQAGIERRRRRAEDRQRQQLGQGRDLHQPVGDDLLDPLGIDAGDVQLGHSVMLEGRRIGRVSLAAALCIV